MKVRTIHLLLLLALAKLLLHTLVNHRYGFHRDELAFLDDARHLAWGYVAYPPIAPWIGRVALELFGTSLVGFRFFSVLAQSCAMVLAGLLARELGGSRTAQLWSAIAMAIAPISVIQSSLFQYVSFDYLWWVLVAYCLVRLLNRGDQRWWLAVGAAIGLGMMTKYTMVFLVAGIVVGVLATDLRRQLTSRWLWGGVALSLLIFLPNLIWQWQHNFISLQFLQSIHARDVAIGRADDFLLEQLFVTASSITVPLWLLGLVYYWFLPAGKRFRLLGWMYVVPLVLMWWMEGRSYYLGPAYPMLLAAGIVLVDQWRATLAEQRGRLVHNTVWSLLIVGGVISAAIGMPIAPINSTWWQIVGEVQDNFVEEIGWEELVATVAEIYATVPEAERATTAILTGNYGEAGALSLYGPAYGLPTPISGVNSYWLRGYGDTEPTTLIVLGYTQEAAQQFFVTCAPAGQITNRYGIENEETRNHATILLCRDLRQPWPILWQQLQRFG